MIIPNITNEVDIDVELIPLIEALNAVGLHTVACCSGHGEKYAYIRLDIKSIVAIITQDGSVDIYWNIPKEVKSG